MPSLRILVVDDEPDLGDMLAEYLTQHGHQVELAADGRGALAILERAPVDLVLSDVLMSVMDGPALFREIQVHYPDLVPHFVWMSGETSREARAQAFVEATGIPVLKKPFVLPQVLAMVEERARR